MKTLNRIAVGFLELRMLFSTTGQTDTNLIFLVWYLPERDVYSIVFIFLEKKDILVLGLFLLQLRRAFIHLIFISRYI